ncbi:GLPGLI family protein [Marinifilum caeruleilacunae]|nr:GLPGLI family protein [Marinifilum caeruleilacunae]
MKKLINLTILLFLFTFVYSQTKTCNTKIIDQANLICIYTHQYQRDSTNKEDIRNENMLLLIGNNGSKFLSENLVKKDSMIYDIEKRNVPLEIAVADISIYPRTNFNYQIFKNYKKGKLVCFDRVFNDKYEYEEDMNSLNWKIEMDTDSIAGMECQKATTKYAGRDYIAWFTKEVPVNEGPYKFHGLPGLIVMVGDTKNHYVFKLKSISKTKKQVNIYYPILYTTESTREGVVKAKYDANQNIVQRLEQMGARFTDPLKKKEFKERAQRKAKQRNNPMELR